MAYLEKVEELVRISEQFKLLSIEERKLPVGQALFNRIDEINIELLQYETDIPVYKKLNELT